MGAINSFDYNKIEREERIIPIYYLESLPVELLENILSFLPSEDIEKLRLVNHRFNDICVFLLRKRYNYVKQEVKICNEMCILRIEQNKISKDGAIKDSDKLSHIFWLAVIEFLTKSFCLFDIFKGHLEVEYSTSGKTIDVVQRILRFKKSLDPALLLVETVIGRGDENCNLMYFENYVQTFLKWFAVKKCRSQNIQCIYLSEYLVEPFEKCQLCGDKWFYTMSLDLLTTLFLEETGVNKHLILPKTLRPEDLETAEIKTCARKPL